MIALCWTQGDPAREKETAAALCGALIRRAFGVSDPDARLGYDERGRPRLSVAGADLSVSHSAGAVLIGLSARDPLRPLSLPGTTVSLLEEETDWLGVDLEITEGKNADRCLRVARRFFAPGEVAFLEALPTGEEQVRAFLTLWTQKESAVKATGEGLRALSGVDVLTPAPGRRFLTRKLTIGGRDFLASACLLKNA